MEERKIIVGDKLLAITPEIVAEMFAEMDSAQQARFFNHVAAVASTWCFPVQLQYITDEDGLTIAGRRVMQEIGDYSHWGLVCNISRDARAAIAKVYGENK